MNRILVIGGTGTVGRQVVSQLIATGARVRAMARNPDAAGLPSQVEVVRGDLTLPETLDACLDGIDTVFLVWIAPPAAVAPALERIARARAAHRIPLGSAQDGTPLFPTAQSAQGAGRTNRAADRDLGLDGRFCGPECSPQMRWRWWAPQIRAGDVVRWPYLAAPTAPIDERDIAAVAVRALCEDGHAGAEYVLTGPQSLSQFEQMSDHRPRDRPLAAHRRDLARRARVEGSPCRRPS